MMLVVCKYFKLYLNYKTIFVLLASCVIIYLIASHYSLIANIHFASDNDGRMQQVEKNLRHRDATMMQDQTVHLVVLFCKANDALEKKFAAFIKSLSAHASVPVVLHLVGDDMSHVIAKKHVKEQSGYKMNFYNLKTIAEPVQQQLKLLQKSFSYKNSYYSNTLFFISTVLHLIFPQQKILMIDIDVYFLDDIRKLHQHFDNFPPTAIIGVAYEQQPVYRHVFQLHRHGHPNTSVGDPPPRGFPGFNSGVLLLHLQRMRESAAYEQALQLETVERLLRRYSFKGHLGDQDFFTLVALDSRELFYVLPCGWNRQLCDWWRQRGYGDVFQRFHACADVVSLYHGNCNSFIPVA